MLPVLLAVSLGAVQPAFAADSGLAHAPAVPPFTVLRSPATVASGLAVAAGASALVPAMGVAGLPSSGVTAVAVRVTVRERTQSVAGNVPGGTVAIAPWTPPAVPGTSRVPATASTTAAAQPTSAAAGDLVAYGGSATTDGFALVGLDDASALKIVNQGGVPVSVSVHVEGYAGRGGAVVPLTRPRTLAANAAVRAGQEESLPVTGVPSQNVAGLLVELTASAPTSGQLTGGTGALLDNAAGHSVSSLAVMSESAGRIALRNDSADPVRVSAALVSYLSDAPAAGGGKLTTVSPAAVTPAPVRVAAHGTVSVPVAGHAGVPQAGAIGATLGITARPARPGSAGALSVGLTNSPDGAADCAATASACTGFAVTRLSSAASDGSVPVHNFSDQAALVSLDAFGYLAAPTAPAAPRAVTARTRGSSAVVSWLAPSADGGSGIMGYAVTMSPGGKRLWASGRASKVTIPGIGRDVSYTVTVTARNAVGLGAMSVASLVPAGTPGAPGSVTVRADGGGRFLVSWSPASAHGAPISGYTVTAAPSRVRVTASAASSSVVLSKLTGGSAYVPCVTAASSTGATAQSCARPLLVNSDTASSSSAGSAGSAVAQATAAAPGSRFTPVAPVLLMDTRNGTGGVTGPVASDTSVSLQVAGTGGVPSTGVTAVVVNVVATAAADAGYITVYPDGESVPPTSSLDFPAGQTTANLVSVEVGSDGKVDFYNGSSGTVQLVADLAGYYSASGSLFTPVAPVRLMDTRNGTGGVTGPVASDTSVSLQVAGAGGMPSTGVAAVVFHVVAIAAQDAGYITVYPDGESVPPTSNVDFPAGQTTGNLVSVEVGSDGKVDFYNGSGGTVQLVADLAGYYSASGSLFTPVAPVRLMDTRNGTGGVTGPVASDTSVSLQVAGAGGVPSTGVAAVVIDVVAIAAPDAGYVTVYPDGESVPPTSNLDFPAGQTTGSLVSEEVGSDGKVDFYNGSGGTVQLVADLAGYYTAPPGPPTGVSATAGNGQATVTWTAPASTGGSAITSYTVAASPGSATATVAGTATTATVAGLTNGTSYTFTVTAATVGGTGPPSAASNAVTPASAPGAPTNVTATAGNAQATVTWTAPSNGGSPITSYAVISSADNITDVAGTATSATVTGLTNGTSYTFTVQAYNAAGYSALSAPSNAVTPVGPPAAPVISGWTVGNGEITIDWSAPDNGGKPLTGYTITMQPGGATYQAAATATSDTITGLTDGTSYTFSMTATNSLGTGPASTALGPVIPLALPGAPTGVSAVAASGSATVTWTPPTAESNEVTGYTVTTAPGDASLTVPGTATAAMVTGLTNGTSYTFTVTATNATGTGPASAASAPVTPGPVPDPPTDVEATAGNAMGTVTWTAPAGAASSAISGYTVTAVPGGATRTVGGTAATATFTGLTNGSAYRFTVVATNSYGNSVPSGSSPPITPAAPTSPDAPFITNATAEDSAVEVTWVPPDTGTASLTGYVITASSGGSTVSTTSEPATATEATVTGLTDGTEYTFTIAAVNGNGTSPASPPSVPVAPLPATAPMAPANVIAVPQNGGIQVSWAAPPDDGSPITSYTVTVSPATIAPVTTAPDTTVATLAGLTNGTAYTVSVTATNEAGTGPAGQAAPVTPEPAIVPSAPTGVLASVTASGTVSVSWSPAMEPGTAAVSGYTVTADSGSTVAATQQVGASACTGTPAQCTTSVTGLTASTAYTFTVTATSTAGTGPASTVTDPITPTLTVATAPVMLSSAAATLRYVDSDGTLIFEQPPASVTGLTAGELVYVPATSADPDGFLGQVVKVTTAGGFVEVATSPASLSNVYSAYDASLDVPVNGADASLSDAAPGVSLSRPEIRGRPLKPPASLSASPADSPVSLYFSNDSVVLEVDADVAQGTTEEASQDPVTIGPVANLNGTVTLTPDLHVGLHSGTLGFNIGGKLDADLTATLGGQINEQENVLLGKVEGPTVVITVGDIPVPVKIVFTVYAVLKANGTVGVKFSVGYSRTLGADCQIVPAGGIPDSCTADDQDNGESGGLTSGTSVFGSFSASVGFQLGVSAQIAFVGGPEVELDPEVTFTADTSANPWWTLALDGSIGVAVTFGQAWTNGDTLYSNPNLYKFGPKTLASAGGPLNGLQISPAQASIAPGDIEQFQASNYVAGAGVPVTATWSVVSGPGTISSAGLYTAPETPGVAVVKASYDGLTAQAVAITGAALQSDTVTGSIDAEGLVDAAEAAWRQLSSEPSQWAVTATPDNGAAADSGEVIYVPGTAVHAYLPGLTPGQSYTLTLYAVGAGGGIFGSASGVVPLAPLPATEAGSQYVEDVATNSTTGKPDDTGWAGGDWDSTGDATVSGNGEYVFFFTEADSNLAPASIYNPADTDPYLVRKDLLTGEIDVASIGPDGTTPIPASSPGQLVAAADGSSVAFQPDIVDASPLEVHDFSTATTWSVGGSGQANSPVEIEGMSANGQVVVYGAVTNQQWHLYRQEADGAPQQVDYCPDDTAGTCWDDSSVSISGDGNTIAYAGKSTSYVNDDMMPIYQEIYLYSEASGALSTPLPQSTCQYSSLGVTWVYACFSYDDPVLSSDGSTLAGLTWANYAPVGGIVPYPEGTPANLFTTRVGTGVEGIVNVATDDGSDAYSPIALSQNGGTLVYSDTMETLGFYQVQLYADHGGTTLTAPQLSTTGVSTVSVTADGTAVVYTLWYITITGSDPLNYSGSHYPGVYLWGL